MKRTLAMILALVMVLSLFAVCGKSNTDTPTEPAGNAGENNNEGNQTEPQAAAQQLDLLRVGVTSWPANLDPATKMGKTCTRWIVQVYDTLLYAQNDGSVTSYLCESWNQVDEKTYEFKLKEGVTFHNGYPMTAEDVKFSFDRVLFDESGYVDPNITAVVGTIESVEAVDALTVRITTKNVDPIILDRLASYLGVYIISKQYYEEVGAETFGTAPVGTGPYKITSITPENMILDYYEGYYGEAPVAKRLEYRYIAEETALLTGLMTGEIDLAPDLGISSAEILKAQAPNVQVFNAASSAGHLLRFKTADSNCDNKLLRQALSLAIDRQLLVDTLWEGYASVPNGYNYPEFGQYYIEDYPTYEYNVEKAKDLLAQSGYDGAVISYQLIPGYYAMGAEAAEAIVDMWKAIGVNAQVEYVEAIKTSTIVDMANWSNGLRFSDPLGGLWALWGEGTGPQKDLWDAPERFNELGHLVESETDVEQRKAYYREMLEIWDDEVPGTILYCPDAIWAVREGLTWSYESGRAINLRAEYLTAS